MVSGPDVLPVSCLSTGCSEERKLRGVARVWAFSQGSGMQCAMYNRVLRNNHSDKKIDCDQTRSRVVLFLSFCAVGRWLASLTQDNCLVVDVRPN